VLIEPAVHDRFVEEFGLNMLNTLTLKENRVVAHKRRIFVFDERGGMFGGRDGSLTEFQNLTTGVFHSRQRRIVGVRYRCRPNTLQHTEVGAFHTHPAAYSTSLRQVRQRIERLLWMRDKDVKAFLKQHELYGYQWHFIGTMDLGCFHIDDVKKDIRAPREVIRYGRLEEAVERLAPNIRFYDQILRSSAATAPTVEMFTHILKDLTPHADDAVSAIAEHDPEHLPLLAGKIASRFQLLGYSCHQVMRLVGRALGKAKHHAIADFQSHLRQAYDRLSVLSS